MAGIERDRDRPRGPGLLISPTRWPVRWRIAAISAGLTFVILVVFAVVVGRLASDRLESDFEDEVVLTANQISAELSRNPSLEGPLPIASVGTYQIVLDDGRVIVENEVAPELPPPDQLGTGVTTVGKYSVYSPSLLLSAFGNTSLFGTQTPPLFVQYSRDRTDLLTTIDRLWLFLWLGVIGGTLLATFAGLTVANRAMRPISDLTATARKIAATRDPSRRVPQPAGEDEVAELARTLDQMLRELDAARTETEHMVQTQREFVADASHELRTPLTSILANLELLQEELSGAEGAGERDAMVASALRSSQRMRRLVGDLLLLARADAGRTGARAEVDLARIAGAALREVSPVANGHVLELHASEPVPVEGNADELHRLALNLLDNGLRHTPPGSEIALAVERRNGDAVLEVSDNGPGIPPELGNQVFSRFVRGGGAADASPDSGTGLGLAIVKAVANSHGGEVEAGSSAGGGARFTVTLPLRAPDPTGPSLEGPSEPRAPGSDV